MIFDCALDLIKCVKQFKYQRLLLTYAPISELPSNISTVFLSNLFWEHQFRSVAELRIRFFCLFSFLNVCVGGGATRSTVFGLRRASVFFSFCVVFGKSRPPSPYFLKPDRIKIFFVPLSQGESRIRPEFLVLHRRSQIFFLLLYPGPCVIYSFDSLFLKHTLSFSLKHTLSFL